MLAIPENDIVKIVRLHDGYHSVFGSSSQVPLPVSVPLLFRFMTHWLRGSSPLYLSASASARSRSLPRPRLDLGLRSTVSCFASLPRKEVIQPHLPIRLPCYDFTPVISLTFGSWPLAVTTLTSGAPNSHGVTGGVYKARERIHRGILIRDY